MFSGHASSSGKRLFLGLEALGPWPVKLAQGRIIPEEGRHATLAFLGFTKEERLADLINMTPPLPWQIGLTTIAKAPLLLPPRKPRCLSLEIEPLENKEEFFAYQEQLSTLLVNDGFLMAEDKSRSFIPHITVARAPFNNGEWIKSFHKQLITLGSMHLYQSLGNSTYKSLHTWPVLPPFEEMSHTADLAFLIRGSSIQSLALHAFSALVGVSPSLFQHILPWNQVESLNDLIKGINSSIARLDIEEGSPFKAVSYHGDIQSLRNGVFEWEMIVDV